MLGKHKKYTRLKKRKKTGSKIPNKGYKNKEKRLQPLWSGKCFSPMFKKTTKVKFPCILLSFTAVVNKKRLIETELDKQSRALDKQC